MFVFSADTFLQAVRDLQPTFWDWWETRADRPLTDGYAALPDISVDYAIVEKIPSRAMHRFNVQGDANSLEEFYEYYKDIVSVEIDTSSSICVVKIKAFTPQTAHSLIEALLFLGEGLINELNARSQHENHRQ